MDAPWSPHGTSMEAPWKSLEAAVEPHGAHIEQRKKGSKKERKKEGRTERKKARIKTESHKGREQQGK